MKKKMTRLEKACMDYYYKIQDLLCNPINEDLPSNIIDPLCYEAELKFISELFKNEKETIEFLNEHDGNISKFYLPILRHFKSNALFNLMSDNIKNKIKRNRINEEYANEHLARMKLIMEDKVQISIGQQSKAFIEKYVMPEMGIIEINDNNLDNIFGFIIKNYAAPLAHAKQDGKDYNAELLDLSCSVVDEITLRDNYLLCDKLKDLKGSTYDRS